MHKDFRSEIRRIDDLSDWQFKLHAPINKKKLSTQSVLAKAAVSSLYQAINLLESVSAELGETANSVFEGYKQFMQETIIPNAILSEWLGESVAESAVRRKYDQQYFDPKYGKFKSFMTRNIYISEDKKQRLERTSADRSCGYGRNGAWCEVCRTWNTDMGE